LYQIPGIGQLLLKLLLVVGWYTFLRHSVVSVYELEIHKTNRQKEKCAVLRYNNNHYDSITFGRNAQCSTKCRIL